MIGAPFIFNPFLERCGPCLIATKSVLTPPTSIIFFNATCTPVGVVFVVIFLLSPLIATVPAGGGVTTAPLSAEKLNGLAASAIAIYN